MPTDPTVPQTTIQRVARCLRWSGRQIVALALLVPIAFVLGVFWTWVDRRGWLELADLSGRGSHLTSFGCGIAMAHLQWWANR